MPIRTPFVLVCSSQSDLILAEFIGTIGLRCGLGRFLWQAVAGEVVNDRTTNSNVAARRDPVCRVQRTTLMAGILANCRTEYSTHSSSASIPYVTRFRTIFQVRRYSSAARAE